MYGLKDNIALLILPLCVSTMNVIILRTYIANSIPGELMEAAKIDGAGELSNFLPDHTSTVKAIYGSSWIYDGNCLLE